MKASAPEHNTTHRFTCQQTMDKPTHEPTVLNVALCSDSNYYEGLETALASIFRFSHHELNHLGIFVVDGGLTSEQKNRLDELALRLTSKYQTQAKIHWQTVESSTINALKSLKGSFTFYVRLLLPELFPEQSWMLWVDSDILCMKNMSSVSSFLDENTPIFCAIDAEIPTLERETHHPHELNTHQFDLEAPYVNTGLSLINLDLWRAKDLTRTLLDWAHKHKEHLVLFDQSIINWNLSDQLAILPPSFNILRSNPGAVLKHEDTPINYHFAGSFKPWLLNFEISLKFAPMAFCQVITSYEYLKVRALDVGEQHNVRIHKLHDTAQELLHFLNRRSLSILSRLKVLLYRAYGKRSRTQRWKENHHFYSQQIKHAKSALLKVINDTQSGKISSQQLD